MVPRSLIVFEQQVAAFVFYVPLLSAVFLGSRGSVGTDAGRSKAIYSTSKMSELKCHVRVDIFDNGTTTHKIALGMANQLPILFAVPPEQAAKEGWIRSTCIPLGVFGNMVILTQLERGTGDASTMEYFELPGGVRRYDEEGIDTLEIL